MDYFEIGQRIRTFRKQQGMSQEALAEKINISTTHMSHIETGSTKLSLPVLADIARVLNVRTDALLHDCSPADPAALDDVAEILEQCSPQQARILVDLVKAVKLTLDIHMEIDLSVK